MGKSLTGQVSFLLWLGSGCSLLLIDLELVEVACGQKRIHNQVAKWIQDHVRRALTEFCFLSRLISMLLPQVFRPVGIQCAHSSASTFCFSSSFSVILVPSENNNK